MNDFEKDFEKSEELAVFDEVQYSVKEIEELLEKGEYRAFRSLISELPSADIAEIMCEVPKDRHAMFFRLLPKDTAVSAVPLTVRWNASAGLSPR